MLTVSVFCLSTVFQLIFYDCRVRNLFVKSYGIPLIKYTPLVLTTFDNFCQLLPYYIIYYTSDMISILSCENTCPHGGLRSPWIPWDMGPGQGHMSHGLGPKPLGRGARRGVREEAALLCWGAYVVPGRRPPCCTLALGPRPKGSKDSLGPHVGMHFQKKVWKLN